MPALPSYTKDTVGYQGPEQVHKQSAWQDYLVHTSQSSYRADNVKRKDARIAVSRDNAVEWSSNEDSMIRVSNSTFRSSSVFFYVFPRWLLASDHLSIFYFAPFS
jgi:hypothetical protein